MAWEILVTDQYEDWFLGLKDSEQIDVQVFSLRSNIMAKPLSELRKKISSEVQAAARAKAVGIVAGMSLAETRKLRGRSQVVLAEDLGIAQPNVSSIEKRPDTLVSTLISYIEALGGTVEIHAKFPDGQYVEITQFKQPQ